MFLFWHFDLFYFFVQFFAKEMFWKLFFSIFLQFLIHVLIPSGTKFITNIETVSEKKNPRHYLLVFGNVSKRQLPNIGWNQQTF